LANYTYAQLEAIWLEAAAGTQYDTQTWAAIMAAIAEAESGGNPNATNPTDNNGTQTSWGLWQISLGNHNEPSPTWNNPITNAQLAIQKLETQGLTAWGTYDSGAYKAYLNESTTPATSIPAIAGAAATDAASAATSAAETVDCAIPLNFLANLSIASGSLQFCLISKVQVRALLGGAFIVAGGGIGLLGVLVLLAEGFEHTGAGRALTKVTGTVASAGATVGLA
jgi:Lysozyme like domain